MFLHTRRQRFDIRRIVVIVRHEFQRRHRAHPSQGTAHLVEDCTGGCSAILRKHRDREDSLGACLAQRIDGAGDGGTAGIEHGKRDRYSIREQRCFDACAQRLALHGERRTRRRPDRGIFFCAGARPNPQDDAVQNRPPQKSRQFDHTRVAEQAREKGANIARCERRRCAGIDQQHAPFHDDSQSRGFRYSVSSPSGVPGAGR